MTFLTLTVVRNEHKLAIDPNSVRVLEEQQREVFEKGEWKPSDLPATLVTLCDGTSFTVAEPVADILKQLESL